ncbi:hypothetical protein [Neptuniibacter sp. QD37_11]|uniref:hypothetical protein n=1 Tax=Neptuniibacter sp. QD37_11 TaxID=3398209 RepID=UPI0039F5A6F5
MPSFNKEDKIRHTKGSEYIVKAVPNEDHRLESSNEPFYAYKEVDSEKVWYRAAKEMEDGRFTLVS